VTLSDNQTWDNENIFETGTDSNIACSNNKWIRNVSWGATSRGRSLGIFLRCASNMLIANNTFVNMDQFVFAIGTSSGFSGSIDNMRITNNISYMNSGKVYGIDTAISSTVSVDNNLEYIGSGAYIGSVTGKGSTNSLATFTSWSGLEKNGINADPKFVNLSGGDYHLAAGSPAIDRGVVIAGVTDGSNGPPDLGRYER